MKYPLDQLTFNETVTHLVSHANMQAVLIEKMAQLLAGAMDESEYVQAESFKESKALLEDLQTLQVEHEGRRWNEANYQAQFKAGVLPTPPKPTAVVNPVKDGSKNTQFNLAMDVEANRTEEEFGGEMSEEDLERHFGQKPQIKKREKSKDFKDMTLDEIQSWEAAQNNSNDIYKIKARVANLARGTNASLTPQGEILVNSYVHVMKSLYDFAEKIEDKTLKINLTNLVRSHEGLPGTIIAAAGAGVRDK